MLWLRCFRLQLAVFQAMLCCGFDASGFRLPLSCDQSGTQSAAGVKPQRSEGPAAKQGSGKADACTTSQTDLRRDFFVSPAPPQSHQSSTSEFPWKQPRSHRKMCLRIMLSPMQDGYQT